MDLEKAYNKIDNFCCLNSMMQGNKIKYRNGEEETIDMFKHYQETKDDDFCKDIVEMIEALETIKAVIDLQKKFDCPLDIVLKIRFGDICFIYDENGNKFFINGGEIFKSLFSAYHRIYRSETDWEFVDKTFKWKDYGKTWWIKADRSE